MQGRCFVVTRLFPPLAFGAEISEGPKLTIEAPIWGHNIGQQHNIGFYQKSRTIDRVETTEEYFPWNKSFQRKHCFINFAGMEKKLVVLNNGFFRTNSLYKPD